MTKTENYKLINMTWIEWTNTGKQLKSKEEKALIKHVRIKR